MTSSSSLRLPLGVVAACLALLGTAVVAAPAQAVDTSSSVVISEVYGGGGNSGAPYNKDFIELYNSSDASVSVDGWSVQYGSAGGKAEYPLPEPQTTKIEIPGSLGGVTLGQTKDEVFAQWGDEATCGKNFCHWGANSYPYQGYAEVGFENGVVSYVDIGWIPHFVDGKRPIRRSITKFHTAEGIRLKSTAKEVKKAFPDATTVSPGNDTLYKFATDDATMYIEVGRFVEEIFIHEPGFSFDGE